MESSPPRKKGLGKFPSEIAEEILYRVPAKQLASFKIVNKEWLDLISNRYFVKNKFLPYQKKLDDRWGLLFQNRSNWGYIVYIVPENGEEMYKRRVREKDLQISVLCSAHELVLCCNLNDEFILCNPMSGDGMKLPPRNILFKHGSTKVRTIYGMGYLGDSDEYKIVRVSWYKMANFVSSVDVFSTKTQTWRSIGAFPMKFYGRDPGVWVGGCINWLVSEDLFTPKQIVAFDCKKEKFNTLWIPFMKNTALPLGESMSLGSLDDQTLTIYTSMCESFNRFEIWILREYNRPSTWERLRFMCRYEFSYREVITSIQPLKISTVDGQRKLLLRCGPEGQFVEYDMSHPKFTKLDIEYWESEWCSIFPYVPSIVDPIQLFGN